MMSASSFIEHAYRILSKYWPTTSTTTGTNKLRAFSMLTAVLSSGLHQLIVASFLIAIMGYFFFRPILMAIMRRPLRTYLGMEFGDFRFSIYSLSVTFTDIELMSESPITRELLALLFPSTVVQKYNPSADFPASKITVDKMRIGLRMGLIVINFDRQDDATTIMSQFTKQMWNIIFQRPRISFNLNGVTVHAEKAYLAPRPSLERINKTLSMPSAISSLDDIGSEIPVFDEDYLLNYLRADELRYADSVTFWIERWLRHALNKGETPSPKTKTDDEKSNDRLKFVVGFVLRSLSITLTDASIVISGAGTKIVKDIRNTQSPRETNAILAKLPKRQRSLTIIGTDSITISCSPDVNCNLLICLVGVHIKVGDPTPEDKNNNPEYDGEIRYAWQMVTYSFDASLELKGLLPIIVWVLNYDHDWPTRKLELNLTTSAISISLSPEHLQTVLLHLDDYIDARSPYNEWYMWLHSIQQETLLKRQELLDKKERINYCRSYALLKGARMNEPDNGSGCGGERLSSFQITQFEKQLTRFEILSLRCIAMENGWKIPTTNIEFSEFLINSKSGMCGKGSDSRATSLDVPIPLQRLHQTPQHALAVLVMNKYSFLSPKISISFSAKAVQYKFPRGSSTKRNCPSSLCLADLSLTLHYTRPVQFHTKVSASSDMYRPLISLSIHSRGLEWNAIGTKIANEQHSPAFANNSLVGLISKQRQAPKATKVFRAEIMMSVSPTKKQDPFVAIDLWSSDLVIVVNPLPLKSAVETIIELSSTPFGPPMDLNDAQSSDVVLRTKVHAGFANTSILFMSDCTEILRGVLVLEIDDLSVKIQSTGMSGDIALLTVPITIRPGQVVQHMSSADDAGIEWTTLPCKPILSMEGIRLRATGKEQYSQSKLSQATPSCIDIDIDVGAEMFFFNASPSTLIALMSVSTSLGPMLEWAAGDVDEEERIRVENEAKIEEEKISFSNRREALRAVFNSVDIDESGRLHGDEIENMIHVLMAENIQFGNDISQIVHASQRLTQGELKRELHFLLSTLDPVHQNEISYQDIDSVLFIMAHNVDDMNLCPKIGTTGVDYLDEFSNSKSFLSARTMRSLIYFDDLREYAAMHEVYRLTGYTKLVDDTTFPAPSLWHQGQGIDMFWDAYTCETGCSQNSLNGHNAALIQRKLVRCLCNYQFAKYCWKSIVQPQLHAANGDGEGADGHILTYWLLDDDPLSRMNNGVLDRLLLHIHHISKEPQGPMDTQFRISLAAGVDKAILTFGSSHAFTNSLFCAEFSQVDVIAVALLSAQTGWFVSENNCDETENKCYQSNLQTEIDDGNSLYFRGAFSVYYLNTKHNHMECFIESYPCFGNLAHKSFVQESLLSDGNDSKTAAFTVNVNCPRSLNINVMPSFFRAVSILSRAASQLDFKTYREIFMNRENEFLLNLWDKKDLTKSGYLGPDEAMEVLCLAGDIYLKNEFASLTVAKKEKLVRSIFNIYKGNEVAYRDVQKALNKTSSRYFCSGCQEMHVVNETGREIKMGTSANEEVVNVEASSTAAVYLSHRATECQLTLSIDRYKPVHGISISPYQSSMIPLIRMKRKAGAKPHNLSGFSTYLTLCPKSECLDSISMLVRPCVTIQTDVPIRVRIVRLGKSLGYLKKRIAKSKTGARSQIDYSKKGFLVALNRLVEGAQVVYEKDDVIKGVEVPLPLSILDSSHHYHVLLVFDGTNWRDPVLLTKEFLFNPMSLKEVSRCHALSGIVIRKERLNICLPHMRRFSPLASESKKSIMHRTAWDTTIQVVPFFLLSNSMPFPIFARSWQLPKKDETWRDYSFLADEMDESNDEILSSDDDITSATPSIKCKGVSSPFQVHKSDESKGHNGNFFHVVARGETLQMSGINLREPLFIQLSQKLNAVGASVMWSKPIQIDFGKLRTGINPKGTFALPKIPLELGDSCSVLLDVSVESGIRMPICTIFSPCWIMNKTGAKLGYKIKVSNLSKRYYLDSGCGGLPIMLHCGKLDRYMSVTQLEYPRKAIAEKWWDVSCNGSLVMKQHGHAGDLRTHIWSETISLDSAGTSEEIQCGQFSFSVTVESLAGSFYRSNLITLAPRFILKNKLHINITILPICGTKSDAMQKARELRQSLSEHDERRMLNLCSNESTIIYNFVNITAANVAKMTRRWIAFCVNSTKHGNSSCKWHLIPIEKTGSTYFGEHDGLNSTMSGIVEAKVHQYDGAKVASVTHVSVPPFRIENRSSDHVIQFVQDDDDAVVFELLPMHSCGFTWDNPHGKKLLRAVVIATEIAENGRGIASYGNDSSYKNYQDMSEDDCLVDDESLASKQPSKVDRKSKSITVGDFCSQSTLSYNPSRASKQSRRSLRLGWVYSASSRSYNLSKVGIKGDLPCPSELELSPVQVHLRISAGMKILSFNDSPWFIERIESGLLKKGGDFKSAVCNIRVDGFTLYIMDDFPREVMGVIMKDLHVFKRSGSIEAGMKIRHFQVDSMLDTARYPIIIQPKQRGVDRHASHAPDRSLCGITGIDESDCFWLKSNDMEPIIEVAFSYVPQSNMTWVPNIELYVCPMKVQLDVDYILRVVGMLLYSASEYKAGASSNSTTTTHANNELRYVTSGQLLSRLTYIENLYIAEVLFEVEINLKPDEDHPGSEAGESDLTLNSIASSTTSAAVAGILSWVINVGANFAHVSPTFTYNAIVDTDRYCDIVELATDIAISYIVRSIKQSYKVIFAMNLLGDPSLLAYQYKTGISDLVLKTRDEVAAGGKDGFGKGIVSFSHNVVGGTFFAMGKISGGLSETLESIVDSQLVSSHLKPKLAVDERKRPRHVIQGLNQGMIFLGRTIVHGVAGLIGNPYRGMKTSTSGPMVGFSHGIVSGTVGFIMAPFIGALGLMAKTCDGIGATTRFIGELGAIESRCRPARIVSWGAPMNDNELSYLKGVGIRIHSVRYQKVLNRTVHKDNSNRDDDDNGRLSSREFLRLRAAEDRRKNPPRKVVNILYKRERQYNTSPRRPKLLTDQNGSRVVTQDKYSVCFEETIILESSNLQLTDEVVIQFRNNKTIKSAPGSSSKLSGVCTLTIGDIHSMILHYYRERLSDIEASLAEEIVSRSNQIPNADVKSQGGSNSGTQKKLFTVPAPQEYSLFRPAKAKMFGGDIFEAIGEEMEAIREAEEEAVNKGDSESAQSESDASFIFGGSNSVKAKAQDRSEIVRANERLFGSVSMSFFPVM